MKKLRVLFFFSLFFSVQLSAQTIDLKTAEQQLDLQLSQYRSQNQLPDITLSEKLNAVAFEQAEYILDLGRLTHTQEKEEKESLADRLSFFEAPFADAGELILDIKVGSKYDLSPDGTAVEVKSETSLIKAAIYAWQEDEETEQILDEPHYYRYGRSILEYDEKVILVVVMASLPYQNSKEKKLPFDHYGVEPYQKAVCDRFIEEHGTLPQLFSEAISVEGQKAYFNYHSLSYFESIIQDGGDALAVDLVARDQYDCRSGNRLFPGAFVNGLMLKPAKKTKLINANEKIEEKEVKVHLADLPEYYTPADYELNLIIIKKGVACELVPYNQIETKNLSKLPNRYLLQGDTLAESESWLDTLKVIIPYRENKLEPKSLENLSKKVKLLEMDVKRIRAIELLPPNKPNAQDTGLERRLLGSLKLSGETIKWEQEKRINWQAYYGFQENSFYEIETKGMDSLDLSAYLIETAKTDAELNEFLNGIHQLKLELEARITVNTKMDRGLLIDLMKSLIKENKIERAAAIQRFLIEHSASNDFQNEIILDPAQKKRNLPIINNQFATAANQGEKVFAGNRLHLAALELHLVDQGNAIVSYNYALAALNYYASHQDQLEKLEELEDLIESLQGKKIIPSKNLARLKMQYHLIAANYHYEKEDFNARKKDFKALIKWQPKADLNSEEVLSLAQYFCFQDQFPKAIQVIEPVIAVEPINSDLLFYYLQIVRYDAEQFNKKKFSGLLELAQEQFPKQFCDFFSKQKQGIQILEDLDVKELYCKSCDTSSSN